MLMLGACSSSHGPQLKLDAADWQQYKQRFVAGEGRVVDNRNAHVSHSEGQGYGLLLAVAFGDRQAFDRIWQWTRSHLQVRGHDHLHAWKWSPASRRVEDYNNATDGDVLIAWALIRAWRQWQHAPYLEAAREILASLHKLKVKLPAGEFLLPGAKGFGNRHRAVLNPSYFLFPAYKSFASVDQGLDWMKLYRDASYLLQRCVFGEWGLPANWVQVDARVRPAAGREPYFGYDAMRIPLFLAWAGKRSRLGPYVRFWKQFSMQGGVPDQLDLENGFVHMSRDFHAVGAIAALSSHAYGGNAPYPDMHWLPDTAYYDASLILLSQLAWMEADRHEEGSK